MSRKVLALEEIFHFLKIVGTPDKYINLFKQQSELAFKAKPRKGYDDISVSSGFGGNTKKGFVELIVNQELVQMVA